MLPVTVPVEITCAASTVQSLGGFYWGAYGAASYLSGVATAGSVVKATALSPVAGVAPSAAQYRFDGTVVAPASTVTLSAKAVAGVKLTLTLIPIGGVPA